MDYRPYSKAIAGAIAGALVLVLAKQNIIIDSGLRDAFEVIISAAITAAVVYIAPANQPSVTPGSGAK